MRALTLTQPWATLVATGEKTIETRSWQTEHRGVIAIHAAKGMTEEDKAVCRVHPFSTALRKHGVTAISQLPRGAVIATARLTACVKLSGHVAAEPPEDSWERAFGDYSRGRYIWTLINVVALPTPIPAQGMLGLWEWDRSPQPITDEGERE